MFTKEITRLRELSDALLYQQTEEDDRQIRHCIDEVLMEVEDLMRSLQLLDKISGDNDG